tara:strand:+ start:1499 stop:1633 length:135 start_codon:yes stop_codon:yes gene_type:complete
MGFLEIILQNRAKDGKRKPFEKRYHTRKEAYQMTEKFMGDKKKK